MAKKNVKKYLIKYHDGSQVVHYDGCFQPNDVSLCGSDLRGDSIDIGWDEGIETQKSVDCESCLRIVRHVKSI